MTINRDGDALFELDAAASTGPRHSPEQQLALAVIARAFLDLKDHEFKTRQQAKFFLSQPSVDLQWWCEVAGTSQEIVTTAYWRGHWRMNRGALMQRANQ